MDHQDFFEYDDPHQVDILWLPEAIPVNQSAFVRYSPQPTSCNVVKSAGNVQTNPNSNKRMIEFLKKSWSRVSDMIVNEKERVYRHMISERMRREKQKQNYLALHKLLPFGTKSDQNSIIQMAALSIQELHKRKDELRRQNYELEMMVQQHKNNDHVAVLSGNNGIQEMERAHIKFRVVYPSSGIDSMLEVLKCLKSTTGSTAMALQANFSPQELSAQLEMETKIRAGEVEKAVNRTLWEVEKKHRSPFSEIKHALL